MTRPEVHHPTSGDLNTKIGQRARLGEHHVGDSRVVGIGRQPDESVGVVGEDDLVVGNGTGRDVIGMAAADREFDDPRRRTSCSGEDHVFLEDPGICEDRRAGIEDVHSVERD